MTMLTKHLKKSLHWRKEKPGVWTVKYITGFSTNRVGICENANIIHRVEDLNLPEKAKGNYGITLNEALLELKKCCFND